MIGRPVERNRRTRGYYRDLEVDLLELLNRWISDRMSSSWISVPLLVLLLLLLLLFLVLFLLALWF